MSETDIKRDRGTAGHASAEPQSYLFVPGSRDERFERAWTSGTDAMIIDLEDAVEPGAKDAARDAVTAWVSRSRPVLVRINGRGTPWFERDVMLARLDGVAGIVLPKTERPDDVIAVLSLAKRKIPVFPLIETALGMWSAADIAKAPGVRRLMFGTLDFVADMGTDDDRDALNPYRAQLALLSRIVGIESPIDGVTPDVHDVERLAADARNGKQHGFGGKLCIHPKQIAVVHECYGPSAGEIAWAERVVAAVSRADAGAIVVDGKMVDRPVQLRAQRLLASATRRGGAVRD
ncbi:HpcH/HpaI aldolase/citrate lyase family protein [Paraburkholderia sp. MM6662-R1]|uniref:HpcH/HpaI aldolase/citrate lyase family protein n=1 Tax=Paraburkholderia sp. MM6662-R1 TaxID=2991066 RepID=UPI003D20F9D5